VVHVRFQQAAGHLAIADYALSSILGMFGTNPDLAIGEIKVTDLKADQLFTAQGSIVGEEQQNLITRWLLGETAQQLLPLLIRGKPGEFVVMGQQSPVTYPAKSFAWDVMATTNRVVLTQLLLTQ